MRPPNFYEQLPPFSNFEGLADDVHFRPAPADWTLIVTDVKGSTKAIAAGKYKDVNTVGAASIVVARKAMQGQDFPFVFGGDGATLLVGPEELEPVLHNLCGLRTLAAATFGLELRVGCVQVGELQNRGEAVEVARFQLVPGQCVAFLRGGGVTLAEELIKQHPEQYEVRLAGPCEADLEGLSCRWRPIPSRRGTILTILVQARGGGSATYRRVLDSLDQILGGLEACNPVNTDRMRYRTLLQCLADERRYHASVFSKPFARRVFQIILSILIFRLRLSGRWYDPGPYIAALPTHTDFHKFDNTIRMVIDCSPAQVTEIRALLQGLLKQGEIFYGLHETGNSLMTCMVDGLGAGQHIHFLDADNGGYATAAIQLKQQIKEALSVPDSATPAPTPQPAG